MRPDVHLRPDRLRSHAAAAVELSGTLDSARAARPPGESDGGGAAELDSALRRAARELAELAGALALAAAATESGDQESAAAVHRAGRS